MGEFKHVNVARVSLQDGVCRSIAREEERLVTNSQLDDNRVIVGVGKICVFGRPKDF